MNTQKQQKWALGFGCQSSASAEAIVAAVFVTLAKAKANGAVPPAYQLFTLSTKAGHAASHAAAMQLGVSIGFLVPEDLRRFMDGTTHQSALVEAVVGVGSVAEAAALAGAGHGSRLLVPRTLHGGVTCALATAVEGAAS